MKVQELFTAARPNWQDLEAMLGGEQSVIDWHWGSLKPAQRDAAAAEYRARKKGLPPPLSEEQALQIAAAMLERPDVFGPVLLRLVERTKRLKAKERGSRAR